MNSNIFPSVRQLFQLRNSLLKHMASFARKPFIIGVRQMFSACRKPRNGEGRQSEINDRYKTYESAKSPFRPICSIKETIYPCGRFIACFDWCKCVVDFECAAKSEPRAVIIFQS